MTGTMRLARSEPPIGPLSNSAMTVTLPVCFAGTPTEAVQNVPQANPDRADSSVVPVLSVSVTFPLQL
jgi:hypothetical protein